MTLTFADTRNMIAYLTKSDASEGFNQIIDFLNGSSIKYALTVNPNIYVSCIKQFWTSVDVKKVNDVMRLQALVDKKKVIITKATITDALRLVDAEGVECLPNEEILTELARMRYEKPSNKLTFFKAFFSSQWKFLIHTILQCLSAKRTSWNEFSSSMALAVICLTTGDLSSHTTKYLSPALIQKVFANMRRVGKGCFGVETPLFEGMIVEQPVGEGVDEVHDEGVPAAGIATEGAASVDDDEVPTAVDEPSIPSPTPPTPPPQPSQDQPSTSQIQPTLPQSPQDKIAQALEITKLIQRVKKLERRNKLKVLKLRRLKRVRTTQRIETSDDTFMDDVSKQGRMIADMNADVDVTLKDVAAKDVKDAEIEENDKVEPAELQKVVKVVTTAKLITELVTAASATMTDAAPQLATAAALILTTAPSVARRRNGVVIRDSKETATPSTIILSEAKSKDKGKGILVEEPKPLKKQAQIKQDEAYARELEAELNKNIDWDEVIDHVQRKQKEDNVVKKYQALKRKPQTEAQARKNMMIYLRNMAGFKMDYFKGMTYDDIRLIFEKKFNSNMAFLLKIKEQIDDEDSRALKRQSKSQEDKAAKKQKLDEEVEELKKHLMIVPNDDDDVYTEAIPLALKVPIVDYEIYTENNKPYYIIKRADERRYPLTRFTLDQMLNNVRLEVEEESEVSLELLSDIALSKEVTPEVRFTIYKEEEEEGSLLRIAKEALKELMNLQSKGTTDLPNNQIPPSNLSSYIKSNEMAIKTMQRQINVLRSDFSKQEENLRKNLNDDMRNILSSFFQNQPSTSGTLLSNTIPNPKGEMKAVKTRSGLAYEGPSIPTESPPEKVDEQNAEEILDQEHSNSLGSTAQVQPPVVPISIPKPDLPRAQSKLQFRTHLG
nr:reverse transcriptase domain-containing protein [Tanacetum cinerariifolium]